MIYISFASLSSTPSPYSPAMVPSSYTPRVDPAGHDVAIILLRLRVEVADLLQRVDPSEQDVAVILYSLGRLPPPCRRPALVMLSGLPGSGKSTVAHALRRRSHAALIQSDRVRKLLEPRPTYSTEESARVFGAIHRALARLLEAGIPAILDATTLTARDREPLATIAARSGARLIPVWVTAPDHVIRRRLADRLRGARAAHDVSDAGIAVYEQMQARAEPIPGPHLTIDTDGDYLPSVRRLARMMCGDAQTLEAP